MPPSNSGTIERYATPKVEGAGGNCVCLAIAHTEKVKMRELNARFSVLALVLSDCNFLSQKAFETVVKDQGNLKADVVISRLSSPHGQVYGRCTCARHFQRSVAMCEVLVVVKAGLTSCLLPSLFQE